MGICRGGWDHATQAKPAADYDIRQGEGILRAESSGWPRSILVTSPNAHKTARKYLAQEPVAVAYPSCCDFAYLKQISSSLRNDADLVIGLGGGSALDASKLVALDKGLPLVLVPSVVSTGAIIHGFFGKWEGRKLIGGVDDWPWFDCDHVIVDTDLILEAPSHLNTAGIGDVLCAYAGLAEWRRSSKLGIGPSWDEKVVAPAIEQHEMIVRTFPKTLGNRGRLGAESIRFIMDALKDRDSRLVRHPSAPAGEHILLIVMELVNDKSWIHGEIVALASVIIAWHCDESPETLISWLDMCKVRHRPSQMGLNREQLRKGLEAAPKHFAERDINSILRHEPITGTKFEALWEFLETN
jgi:glycerol dehydrogenase-like iron-containing ADH family enzyme